MAWSFLPRALVEDGSGEGAPAAPVACLGGRGSGGCCDREHSGGAALAKLQLVLVLHTLVGGAHRQALRPQSRGRPFCASAPRAPRAGIGASVLLADLVYSVPANVIVDSARRALTAYDVMTSMVKSWVFGSIVATVRGGAGATCCTVGVRAVPVCHWPRGAARG